MTDNKAKWIWYGNDFELVTYHNLVKKRRQRKDILYPNWKMDYPERFVTFSAEFVIPEKTKIRIYHSGEICVNVNFSPWNANISDDTLILDKGEVTLRISVLAEDSMPCIFIDSEYVKTGKDWSSFVNSEWGGVSCSEKFDAPDKRPYEFRLPVSRLDYAEKRPVKGGILFDFKREILGFPRMTFSKDKTVCLFYGESEEEALDYENSEVMDSFEVQNGKEFTAEENRAFRYVFLKDADGLEEFYALEEIYTGKFEPRFVSNDARLNKIYEVAEYTLKMTSREMFIDGPKRDRWVWAGDVLQSILFDLYSFDDKDIIKRTLIGIIGKNEIANNISGVFDYNFYYVISVYYYFLYTGDEDFVRKIYPRLKSLMRFIMGKKRRDGFLMAENEWLFIDWSDIENFNDINYSDTVSIVQILYYRTLEIMIEFENILSIPHDIAYQSELDGLKEKINSAFFVREEGGYFHNGKKTLKSKYGNIFAILLDFVSDEDKKLLADALKSKDFADITTPYMKFYELCAIAEAGDVDHVIDYIDYYWGGMVDEGATTFWEKYIPEQKGAEKYAMYGRKYGKSLCHSWGAGPLFLLGKYVAGLRPYGYGYEKYLLKPYFGKLSYSAELPINGEKINIRYDGTKLYVYCDKKEGILQTDAKIKFDGKYDEAAKGYVLEKGVEYEIAIGGGAN